MFSGIVETLGVVISRAGSRLVIASRKRFKGLTVGESIAVDGVCLTVDRTVPGPLERIAFRLLPETIRISTLGALKIGDEVNLGRSLRLGDRLGGHLLLGHVDGQGTVVARSRKTDTLTVEIKVPADLCRFLVPKGPVGIDGVSLTLDPKIEKDRIRFHLIPYTAKGTTLGRKAVGAKVNIELDLIAKYLRGML